MRRRRLLMAGAGAAAAGAGVGWQLWRAPPGLPAPPLDAATLAFWQSSYSQPDGQTLAMSTLRGQPLVLNFWATWCPPCIQEMPALDRFARQFAPRGGRVLGLAVDNPGAVREFLAKAPVSYLIALAGFEGSGLSRQLGNSTGALPYTAVFDRRGAIVQQKLGETTMDELARWTHQL